MAVQVVGKVVIESLVVGGVLLAYSKVHGRIDCLNDMDDVDDFVEQISQQLRGLGDPYVTNDEYGNHYVSTEKQFTLTVEGKNGNRFEIEITQGEVSRIVSLQPGCSYVDEDTRNPDKARVRRVSKAPDMLRSYAQKMRDDAAKVDDTLVGIRDDLETVQQAIQNASSGNGDVSEEDAAAIAAAQDSIRSSEVRINNAIRSLEASAQLLRSSATKIEVEAGRLEKEIKKARESHDLGQISQYPIDQPPEAFSLASAKAAGRASTQELWVRDSARDLLFEVIPTDLPSASNLIKGQDLIASGINIA